MGGGKSGRQQKGPSAPWFKGTVHSTFVTKARVVNSQFLGWLFLAKAMPPVMNVGGIK